MAAHLLELSGDTVVNIVIADLHDETAEQVRSDLGLRLDRGAIELRKPRGKLAQLVARQRQRRENARGLAPGFAVDELVHLPRHQLDEVLAPLAHEDRKS